MSAPLRFTVALLAAVCLLLLAGAFPLMGAEAVYRGGAMLLLALAVLAFTLWGGWRLAAGVRVRCAFGLVCLFFAGAGVAILWQYGAAGLRMAQQGGAMWAGAIAMFCTALVGVVFTGVFGYLCLKAMNEQRLWLAGAHICLGVLLIGAGCDYLYEQRAPLILPADGHTKADAVYSEGELRPLGFALQIDKFDITHYTDRRYSIYTHTNGRPSAPQALEQRGDRLYLGEESWAVADLVTEPGMPYPFLAVGGETPRVIVQDPPAVKDYAASCTLFTDYKGRPETRHETLRVNEPLECKGWLIYLSDYTTTPRGTQLKLIARRAPGRLPALAGIIGLVATLAFYCFGKKQERE